jgi:glycosyltransferase involved in cell wall biosynthesis
MNQKTRILIIGDSPILPTGMAEVTRLIFEALLDSYPDHYDLHQVGLFHSHSVASPRWPVYPAKGGKDKDGRVYFLNNDLEGQRTFREVVPRIRPDIVFAHNDPQRVLHLCDAPHKRKYKLILYIYFDGLPFPPDQGPLLARADLVVTFSEFSRRVALSCFPAINPEKVSYVRDPADVERFRPIPDNEKPELRKRKLPAWMPSDTFVLGWVGRNQWRKQVWTLYRLIHHLSTGNYLVCGCCGRVSVQPSRLEMANQPCESHKNKIKPERQCRHCGSPAEKASALSDVFLWLHMPDEPGQQAWDRTWLERQFELSPGKDIHYTEGHKVESCMKPAEMPAPYQLWDCLTYLSGGEGFGMPPWEAMCTAVPVVYTNYSSHAEFLRLANAGLPVGGVLQPEPRTCIWRMVADAEQSIEAVRKLYFDRPLGRSLGANGHSYVQSFTPAHQAEQWHQIFQRLLNRGNSA